MPAFQSLPFRLLIGPLHHPGLLGKYIFHPDIRIFVNLNLCSNPEGTFPTQIPLLHHPHSGTLQELLEQLPEQWKPDRIIWWHHYSAIPPDMHKRPCPAILIISDSHAYLTTVRQLCKNFDWVFSDGPTIETLKAQGIKHCSQNSCYSFDPRRFYPLPEQTRDIDIAFIGRYNLPMYPMRNQILSRILPLQNRYKLYIRNDVFDHAYNEILNRSRIMLNWSVRGEMNLRAYEAARCGALLFTEASNTDIPQRLPAGKACILYEPENLVEKICYYLNHPEETQIITKEAQRLILNFSYEKQFELLLSNIPKDLHLHITLQISDKGQTLSYIRNLCFHTQKHVHPYVSQYLSLQIQSHPEWKEDPEILNAWGTCLFYTKIFSPQAWEANWPEPRILFQDLIQKHPHQILLLCNLTWIEMHHNLLEDAWEHHYLALTLLCGPHYQSPQGLEEFLLPFGAQTTHLIWQRQQFRLKNTPEKRDDLLRQTLLWHTLMLGAEIGHRTQRTNYALTAYQQAWELFPEILTPRLLRAYLLCQIENYQQGIEELKSCMESEAVNPYVWICLLQALKATHDLSALHAWAQKGLQISHSVSALEPLKNLFQACLQVRAI